jgi:hypothetical protein
MSPPRWIPSAGCSASGSSRPTPAGYAGLLGWLGGFGTVALAGIEGTGSYGAGLARHVGAAGIRVVEVDRLVVQPQLLKGDEATRHMITVLSPQQAVEPFGKSADHRRRKHMRQLDEGFTLGSIKSVGGCEFHPQLLIVGGVHVGKAGAGHQRYRRIIVLRKRDVPVPPVLIVTCPVLVIPPSRLAGGSGELSAFTSTAAPPHY